MKAQEKSERGILLNVFFATVSVKVWQSPLSKDKAENLLSIKTLSLVPRII